MSRRLSQLNESTGVAGEKIGFLFNNINQPVWSPFKRFDLYMILHCSQAAREVFVQATGTPRSSGRPKSIIFHVSAPKNGHWSICDLFGYNLQVAWTGQSRRCDSSAPDMIVTAHWTASIKLPDNKYCWPLPRPIRHNNKIINRACCSSLTMYRAICFVQNCEWDKCSNVCIMQIGSLCRLASHCMHLSTFHKLPTWTSFFWFYSGRRDRTWLKIAQ